jgi:hypothetical protein
MNGLPTSGDPQDSQDFKQVAHGGHIGIGRPFYADLAARLWDNGYEPIPIQPGNKRPVLNGWSKTPIDASRVEAWCRTYGHCGIGLRTGHLVGVDIDFLDPDAAHHAYSRAVALFGPTLIRVGRWPKRLLLYRTQSPITKLSLPHLEILGVGQQCVAYGVHPETGGTYDWVTGESPCEVPLDQLPLVDESGLQVFLAEAAAQSASLTEKRRPRRDRLVEATVQNGPIRGADGLVVDGRDGWLSAVAFHMVHDAVDLGEPLEPQRLAARAWDRFTATTDLARPKKDGRQSWSLDDAAFKIKDKLGLLVAGRLPARTAPELQPEDLGTLFSADIARARLADAIRDALAAAANWWSGDRMTPAPVSGIRATVGLGKSAISRAQIAHWQQTRKAQGLSYRVLVMTPSHALADEAALDWSARVEGSVAVLRGYEARHPATHEPMCRDHQMVKLARHEDLRVGKSVCYSSTTWHCPHYEGCPKQQNKRDVAAADVVLAPYDILYTGLGAGTEPFSLLVIDEGCWQRAEHVLRGPPVEKFASVGLTSGLQGDDRPAAAAMADLALLRAKAKTAMTTNGPGIVAATMLTDVGLSAADCDLAASLEERCIRDPGIYPGMKPRARTAAATIVKRNETARRLAAIWRAMAHIIGGQHSVAAVLRITPPDKETEQHGLALHNHFRLAESLAALPVLHLDATLRPDLAKLMLPGLQVTRIDAEQPHLHLTLVVGRFGKSTLCAASELPLRELQRRQNRLREVVDHVRWQARRVGSGQVLVVTQKAIEAAFAGIEGVQTAHFNAIAGLDQYRDVRLLIVVGRPLPSSEALTPLAASFFHKFADGSYRPQWRAVRTRTGAAANIRVVAHEDPQAELLRAAICDDEVVQAIGRGRAVNRTEDNPLEVQVLADLALPMVHDRVVAWETIVPDILQRMLLAGMAVDSPADAALIHPEILANVEQSKKAFQRGGFGGHSPIENTYRGMSLKSARYRHGGKGRSWQIAYWLDGEPDKMRAALEHALGALSGWEPRS